MNRVDAVLFDLDDTLHDDTGAYHGAADEVAREIAIEHGIDALELKAAYVAQAEHFWQRLSSESLRTQMGVLRTALWRDALAQVGMDDELLASRSAQRYHRYRTRRFAIFPGARELLVDLRAHDIMLGLLTNGFAETHRERIAVLGLADCFDAMFLADEVGMLKPDPLLFAHACMKLGSNPAHTIMVGDRYDRDIVGAIEAGLRTIWINVRSESLPLKARPPNANVSDIAGVREALTREGAFSLARKKS